MVQQSRTSKTRRAVGTALSQSALAAETKTNQTRISELERGLVPPDVPLARELERALDLPPDALVAVVRQMRDTKVRDYAQPYMRRLFIAEAIYHVGIAAVPGTLQTERYTAALMASGMVGAHPQDVRSLARERWERAQEILSRPNPPHLTTILYEGVLHAELGDRSAVAEQLEYLLKVAEEPNVSVRILPFSAPVIAGLLTLLTFDQGAGRAAYTEGFACGAHTEEPADVAEAQRVYDRLSEEAERPARSLDMIRTALERMT
ncbi:helix-turn-helix domain-containing protein [Streptomyces subrutilus]|uniref:helix-turn-helix domain-containing protein n=1 Tax=Streptomyces subrutilus TaxID=36818 RepID=UPI0033D28505